MSGQHSRPRARRSYQRPLAVIGAAAILVVGIDAVSYAATGSTMLVGKINKGGAVTVLQNTGAGPALSLQTKSTTYAPFATNAKGKVTNLNADKVDGLDAAAIVTKAKTNVNAVTLNGKGAATIVSEARTNVDAATVNGKSAAAIVTDAKAATRAFLVVDSAGVKVQFTPGAAVNKIGVGVYCVSAPGFTQLTAVAVATSNYYLDTTSTATNRLAHVEVASGDTTCGTDFLIRTFRLEAGVLSAHDEGFNIVIA